MKIEAGKFYKTRGGEKVRIYAVDGAGVFSIHGAVLERESWVVTSWNEDGSSDFSESNDIAGEWVEPSPKLKAWIRHHKDPAVFPDHHHQYRFR